MANFFRFRGISALLVVFLEITIFLILEFPNNLVIASEDIPILRSCWELKLAGYLKNGEYSVDPDGAEKGENPFKVYCDMSSGTSIVYHNRLHRAPVPQGFEESGTYRVPVSYRHANIDQLKNLADTSGNCTQFISMECLNVLMWYQGVAVTYWISRDGADMYNWGAPTGVRGCHCRVDQRCDKGQSQCSCNENDDHWRLDQGLLTDKRTLPVKEMRFGDSHGDREMAMFRLGELKCSGQDMPRFTSCSRVFDAGYMSGTYLLHLPPSDGEANGTPTVVHCEKDEPASTPPITKSCAALRQAGYKTDGIYKIDPDGQGSGMQPFSAQCYLSSQLSPPILKSCADLKIAGYSINKEYRIDPDGANTGVDPFMVYCNMFTGTSIVHHDAVPLSSVPYGYSYAGEYHVPIRYDAHLEQVAALIESSKTCKQYISLDCRGVLHWYGEELINWWVSRDGRKMSNWGAPTGSRGCACSMTNSCDNGEPRCNCDVNDMVWRRDDGYITDRTYLPITELRLSDTDHRSEEILYTVGDLECTGMDPGVKASSREEGKPITANTETTSRAETPSNKPTSKPTSNDTSDVKPGSQNADCSSSRKAYTGMVIGFILMLAVVLFLLVALFCYWRNNRYYKQLHAYRSGVI